MMNNAWARIKIIINEWIWGGENKIHFCNSEWATCTSSFTNGISVCATNVYFCRMPRMLNCIGRFIFGIALYFFGSQNANEMRQLRSHILASVEQRLAWQWRVPVCVCQLPLRNCNSLRSHIIIYSENEFVFVRAFIAAAAPVPESAAIRMLRSH